MNLSTLYKRTSTGKAIQQWTISTIGNVIHTTYGQVDGAMQTISDTVDEGKNVGKKNATTPTQQALLEAQAQHERKRKSGYVDSIEKAQAGAVDDVVEGGVLPLLAKNFEDHNHKLVYPIGVQPKLDGHRCFAVIDVQREVIGDITNTHIDVSLWTRTRKRIKSLPHIVEELFDMVKNYLDVPDAGVADQEAARLLAVGFQKTAIGYRLVTDGENYVHSYRDRFEELSSLIRPDEPRKGHEVIEYHVYDVVSLKPFNERFAALEPLFTTEHAVKLVETHQAVDEAALMAHYDAFKALGYEGAMARRLDRPYEHKRSDQLLKMKDFVDAEFKVVRLEEGRGKLQGHIGAFVCVTADGKEFGAKGAMPNETLRQAWMQPEKWIGKMMTVKYFGITAEGSLRFPSALRLRDGI